MPHFLRSNFKLLPRKYVDKEARPTLVLWVLNFVDEKASAASLDLPEFSQTYEISKAQGFFEISREFSENPFESPAI